MWQFLSNQKALLEKGFLHDLSLADGDWAGLY